MAVDDAGVAAVVVVGERHAVGGQGWGVVLAGAAALLERAVEAVVQLQPAAGELV